MTAKSGLGWAWDSLPTTETSAFGIFIDVGSRDEDPGAWGAAHFLEHAVFKGAGELGGRQIAERIDRWGGEVNAFTTRDYTCFYGKSMDAQLGDVYQLVRNLVDRPWLAEDDIRRERQVILSEMADAKDSAEDRVEEGLLAAIYDDERLTHDILGTAESVQALTSDGLGAFCGQHYRPERMVVALAGEAGRHLATAVDNRGFRPRQRPRPMPRAQAHEVLVDEDREQIEILLGVPAPGLNAPGAYAVDVLTGVVGGQTSSRLWQRLREAEGLVYSIHADYQAEPDWGIMTIGLAVHPDRVVRALAAVGEELWRARSEGFVSDELDRAKVQLQSGLRFGLETVDRRMLRLGRYLLTGRRPPTPAEMDRAWLAIHTDDLIEWVDRLWGKSERIGVSAFGPLDGRKSLRALL